MKNVKWNSDEYCLAWIFSFSLLSLLLLVAGSKPYHIAGMLSINRNADVSHGILNHRFLAILYVCVETNSFTQQNLDTF